MEIRTCAGCNQQFELVIKNMSYPVPKEMEEYRCSYCGHKDSERVRGTLSAKPIPVFCTGVATLEIEGTGEVIEVKPEQLRWETEEINLDRKGIPEEVVHTAVFERKNPNGEDIRVVWSISLSTANDVAENGEVEAEALEVTGCTLEDFDCFYVPIYPDIADEMPDEMTKEQNEYEQNEQEELEDEQA